MLCVASWQHPGGKKKTEQLGMPQRKTLIVFDSLLFYATAIMKEILLGISRKCFCPGHCFEALGRRYEDQSGKGGVCLRQPPPGCSSLGAGWPSQRQASAAKRSCCGGGDSPRLPGPCLDNLAWGATPQTPSGEACGHPVTLAGKAFPL